MKSADLRYRNNGSAFWREHGPGFRRVLIQCKVRPGFVIVRNERLHVPIQRCFVEDNHMVQALSPERTNGPFHKRTFPGGPWSRKDLFDSQCFHLFREVSAEDAVAISKQVTWRAIPRKRFTQLVSSPFGSGMSSDVEVDDTAPIMSQHQKYIQHLETDRWHGEEVHRDHALDVVLEEGAPGLRWRLAMAHQILAYTGLANINTKLEQLAVNARCSPQRILATEPTDEFSDVCRNRWPPRLAAAGLPGPEQTKASAVISIL